MKCEIMALYVAKTQCSNGELNDMAIPTHGYYVLSAMLDTMTEFYIYYKAHEQEEDARDHLYQMMQRILPTTSWYKEEKETLLSYIFAIKQYIPEPKIITEYIEYIIYCLEKEEQKRNEAHQAILNHYHIAH